MSWHSLILHHPGYPAGPWPLHAHHSPRHGNAATTPLRWKDPKHNIHWNLRGPNPLMASFPPRKKGIIKGLLTIICPSIITQKYALFPGKRWHFLGVGQLDSHETSYVLLGISKKKPSKSRYTGRLTWDENSRAAFSSLPRIRMQIIP